MDIKRLITALVLTTGFLFVWSKYMIPQKAPVAATSTVATETASATTATPTTNSSTPATTTSGAATQKASTVTTAKEVFKIKSDSLDATFSSASGAIESLNLLGYTKELKKDSPHVAVVPIDQPAPAPLLWNLTFKNNQAQSALTLDDRQTTYQVEEKAAQNAAFTTMVGNQIKVTKEYRLTKDQYVIEQVVRVENQSSTPFAVDADTSLSAAIDPKAPTPGFWTSITNPQHPQTLAQAYIRDEAIHENFKSLPHEDLTATDASISWAGFSSQYFLMAAIPTESMWTGIKNSYDNGVATLTMQYPQRNLAANSTLEYVLKFYTGPKKIEIMEATAPTLDHSIDLGSWIGGLARLIHRTLEMIYKIIPNYGWAIIILTILVRLAVFPLAQMQAKSMKKMALHKPAMDALKAKHANDREAHSRELMTYMRTNKINPASGCLPLLIQFPIFIALYRVLYNSIELRHAPFGFWIHDLSAHDPFFVLPVLVGITFYFQTKLNPTPMADPAQQTMMKIMPIMFSVFMIFLPSGLNLYIFVSTLWGIVQQYMVQKSLK